LTLGRPGACCRRMPEDQRRDGVVVGLLQAVMAQIRWGRARLVRLPVIPSPSWVGMERCGDNTRGRSSGRPRRWFGVRQNRGRARLRPECSRSPGAIERADVAVAQTVVDQCEQFACRCDLGDVAAAAGLDAFAVTGDLRGVGWPCGRSTGPSIPHRRCARAR
jgi:hypothetical protein